MGSLAESKLELVTFFLEAVEGSVDWQHRLSMVVMEHGVWLEHGL